MGEPDRLAGDAMRQEEHQALFEVEDTYWWFVGRRRILHTLLRRVLDPSGKPSRRIGDMGCGTGRNLMLLQEFGWAVGTDLSPPALKWCRQRGLRELVAAEITRLPFADGSLDLVTASEVLEHIQDDAAAAAELARIIRPGGLLLVTVPAYQFLWSEHDEALDHFRRYSAHQTRRLVEEAGLRVERLSHCVSFLLVPICLFRVLQRVKRRFKAPKAGRPKTAYIQMPGPISKLFVWLLSVEAWLMRYVDLPVGVSIVCVARKPGEDVAS